MPFQWIGTIPRAPQWYEMIAPAAKSFLDAYNSAMEQNIRRTSAALDLGEKMQAIEFRKALANVVQDIPQEKTVLQEVVTPGSVDAVAEGEGANDAVTVTYTPSKTEVVDKKVPTTLSDKLEYLATKAAPVLLSYGRTNDVANLFQQTVLARAHEEESKRNMIQSLERVATTAKSFYEIYGDAGVKMAVDAAKKMGLPFSNMIDDLQVTPVGVKVYTNKDIPELGSYILVQHDGKIMPMKPDNDRISTKMADVKEMMDNPELEEKYFDVLKKEQGIVTGYKEDLEKTKASLRPKKEATRSQSQSQSMPKDVLLKMQSLKEEISKLRKHRDALVLKKKSGGLLSNIFGGPEKEIAETDRLIEKYERELSELQSLGTGGTSSISRPSGGIKINPNEFKPLE